MGSNTAGVCASARHELTVSEKFDQYRLMLFSQIMNSFSGFRKKNER